jgi:UDP-2,3-diacylglucosamine pyrophosphatase LpxH
MMTQKAQIHLVKIPFDWNARRTTSERMEPYGCKMAGACRQTQSNPSTSTLNGSPDSYVYLDVGVWAENEYDFGAICGPNVWLCKFTHKQAHSYPPDDAFAPDKTSAPDPLKKFAEAFLATQHGFVVDQYAHVRGRPQPSADTLYLVIPDMHLAALPHVDGYDNLADTLKSQPAVDIEPGQYECALAVQSAHCSDCQKARKADIFGTAGTALCAFLDTVIALARTDLKGKLKVVQMGDMYELWQGMDKWTSYFNEDPSIRGLELEDKAMTALLLRVLAIKKQHRPLIGRFERLDGLGVTAYVYGNHDVYIVDNMRNKNAEWQAHLKTEGVPSRATHLYENSVLFEHGHRMEPMLFGWVWPNRDGSSVGPFITKVVNKVPWLRAIQGSWLLPIPRPDYHRFSALEVCHDNYDVAAEGDSTGEDLGPISVFVMGHTHQPNLKYVQMVRRLRDESGDLQCTNC